MSLLDARLLIPFIVLWTIGLLGLSFTTRRRQGPGHRAEPVVWLIRLILVVPLLLEPHFSENQILNTVPFLSLLPIQTPVDLVGFLLLHRKGRHRLEQVFVWNFIVLLPYLIIPFFLTSEQLVKRRERLAQLRLEQFAESLPRWMHYVLSCLDRYGWAKRRGELNLTRKRSRVLAEMGLAKENDHGSLVITQLGRTVAKVLPKQARFAGREDVALRRQSGRVLESLPGVLRRIASFG